MGHSFAEAEVCCRRKMRRKRSEPDGPTEYIVIGLGANGLTEVSDDSASDAPTITSSNSATASKAIGLLQAPNGVLIGVTCIDDGDVASPPERSLSVMRLTIMPWP